MKIYSTIILILGLCTSKAFCQTQSCLQNANHPNQRTITQVTSTETIVREYILRIPQSYDENIASPLLINLHGFGDCASDYSETIGDFYNFHELADQENFIVAYPQGAYRPEKEDTYWEPGDTGIDNIYENDVYFIEELISNIASEFNLNLDKIYACGYSNGGMMAYSLACNRSHLFAAIGIMSGTMLSEDCTLTQAVPIIKFHGIGDDVLPYGGNLWYQSVDEVVSFWLNKNSIPSNSLISSELNGGNVIKDEYMGSSEHSCLTLYTVHEEFDKPGGHVWFSEEIGGATPNRIMWDFLDESCGIVNSTNEFDNHKLEVKVQSNPFLNQITIERNYSMNQEFGIYNINGILLLKGNLNSNLYTIDLSQLPANVYILNIEGYTKKLVKTK